MPISHLEPHKSQEFKEPSFKRGFWKNFFTIFLFVAVFSALIFLAVMLYVGPPAGEVVSSVFEKISKLFK